MACLSFPFCKQAGRLLCVCLREERNQLDLQWAGQAGVESGFQPSANFLLTFPVLPPTPDIPVLSFENGEKSTVLFYDAGSEQLYVGGRGVLRVLTFKEAEFNQTQVPLQVDEKAEKTCRSKPGAVQAECDNYIQVIQRLNGSSLIACGTNAGSPKCWFLSNTTKLQQDQRGQAVTISGENLAPGSPSQPAAAIAVEGNLYSALSRDKSTIQRSYGPRKLLRTEDRWLTDAEFVSAAWVPEKETNLDEIYFFYNEVNKTAGLDEEPIKARLGRVCKVDEGGKSILVDFWTTFLQARLVCGGPAHPQRFNQLRDAVVLGEGNLNFAPTSASLV
nr:semaphorin-4B-like [Pelodiscus sinensis]|eukprot:XP_006119480.1 semaphorin-4B-like [Pelodiscus sinensis]